MRCAYAYECTLLAYYIFELLFFAFIHVWFFFAKFERNAFPAFVSRNEIQLLLYIIHSVFNEVTSDIISIFR